MKNKSLVEDYIQRSKSRLKAIQTLMDEKSYADVVRGSQEVVELTLKALLRHCLIEVPRIHDVSDILLDNKDLVPEALQKQLKKMCDISHSLRRDRELAYYGSEDLTPSKFYKKEHADLAFKQATWLVETVSQEIS